MSNDQTIRKMQAISQIVQTILKEEVKKRSPEERLKLFEMLEPMFEQINGKETVANVRKKLEKDVEDARKKEEERKRKLKEELGKTIRDEVIVISDIESVALPPSNEVLEQIEEIVNVESTESQKLEQNIDVSTDESENKKQENKANVLQKYNSPNYEYEEYGYEEFNTADYENQKPNNSEEIELSDSDIIELKPLNTNENRNKEKEKNSGELFLEELEDEAAKKREEYSLNLKSWNDKLGRLELEIYELEEKMDIIPERTNPYEEYLKKMNIGKYARYSFVSLSDLIAELRDELQGIYEKLILGYDDDETMKTMERIQKCLEKLDSLEQKLPRTSSMFRENLSPTEKIEYRLMELRNIINSLMIHLSEEYEKVNELPTIDSIREARDNLEDAEEALKYLEDNILTLERVLEEQVWISNSKSKIRELRELTEISRRLMKKLREFINGQEAYYKT